MNRVDLHIHSTVSDGIYSPEAIVAKAAELGMEVIALADHDSVDGIVSALQAARAFPGLAVIPSVEISTDLPDGQAHVLGYFIDYTGKELAASLERFRNSRQRRAQGMLTKLGDLGIALDWQRVQAIAGDGSIGRPHIAHAMLEKNYITSFNEAFDKYIGNNGPAYVARDKMTPAEAVALIVQSDGLPVLAHPFSVNDPEAMLIELKAAGLVGIEAYYKDYTADEIEGLVGLADKYGLITTGGTDYHGIENLGEVMLGGTDVPLESAERLIALADKRVLKLANL